MKLRWSYSFWMLFSYVVLFLAWYEFPSRVMFLISGFAVLAGLVASLWKVRSTGYFVDKVDQRLHWLVIADVLFETISFEAFKLFQPFADVELFHRNTHFFGCASAFALLIGSYRLFAARRVIAPTTHEIAVEPAVN